MADQPETLGQKDDEESELEELEEEVNQMAQKILEFRAKLPDQLKNTLASILAAQRPTLVTLSGDGSEPGPSNDSDKGNGALLAEEDQENADKIQLLKQKISSNASSMPIVLKRMKECMSKMDKLELSNGIIHPAFKKKRTS
ncbi:unnamed protein product [Ilex paraguariensis]|uniref:Uncharacterized protein n=1 Tax=Ilex paraguariensis TaxID=185542 RepID=A0ABC8QNY7_9AQUA